MYPEHKLSRTWLWQKPSLKINLYLAIAKALSVTPCTWLQPKQINPHLAIAKTQFND